MRLCDFFAAIRACYNARASDPAFKRLSFVLLGVATPGDLISDPQRTPFNIGRRMDLTDFTERQALPLADGLDLPPVEAGQVLTWILDWTGGHPYLTQRLCAAAAASPTKSWDAAAVDKLVEETFFGEQSAQDSNLRFVRDMLTQRAPDKAIVLKTYHRIHAGQTVPDEERSPVKTHLKLSGVVKREEGKLAIRNRIYEQVFNQEWISQNMPRDWAWRIGVIYTVGGTVQPYGGIYISRDADEKLLQLCRAGEFCYVLAARQMGKSSLMVATTERLTAEGIRSVEIDLTQLGTELSGLTAEQWYLGLIDLIVDQLDLDVDYVAWWDERARLGPTQRLSQFLRQVVLEQVSEPVVIFIDEVDSTLNLDFTDDFFAAIRACYNARASDPVFKRLSFVLLGVATPGDLISDPQRTPFNIGRWMDLTDFTERQAIPLAAGLDLPPVEADQILTWILGWTGGHPYLTQRLCAAAAASPTKNWDAATVDKLVEETFFGEQSAQDSNLRFVRDMLTQRAPDKAAVLKTYRRIHAGKAVPDEERSPVKTHLKLSGIVKTEDGTLHIRNEIYRRVFDLSWVRENTAVNWAPIVAGIAVFVALLAVGSILYNAWVGIQFQDCVANFYQTKVPEERVAHLAKIFRLQGLFGPTDYDYSARELFYGLSREEQLALFTTYNVEDSDLIVVIKGLYITLANIDGTDSTRPLLEAMVEASGDLQETEDIKNLQSEINSWLRGRELAKQNQYADALAEYDKAIALNGENPATLYERARVLTELSEYQQALGDLDQVMAIARRAPTPTPTASPQTTTSPTLTPTSTSEPGTDITPTETSSASVTATSASLPTSTVTPTPAAIISDFATIGQMISAVRNIIYGNPGLVSSLASAQDSEYLNLREFGLVPIPTPTLVPPGEMPSDLTLTLVALPSALAIVPTATPIPTPMPAPRYRITEYEPISFCGYTEFRFNVKDSRGVGKRDMTIHIWTDWGFDAYVTTDPIGDAKKTIGEDFFDSVWHIELIEGGQVVDQLDVVTTSGCKKPEAANASDYSVWTIHWQEETPTSTVTSTALPTPTSILTPELLLPPILLEPEDGASFIGGPVIFKWQWDRPLAQDENFSLRVHKEGETEICHHASVHALEYTGGLSPCSEGRLYWRVALVRELEEGQWQLASEPSAERWIYYIPEEELGPPPGGLAPSVDFKVITQRMLSMEENGGDPQVGGCGVNHTMYINVIDINGSPLDNVVLHVAWPGGEQDIVTGETGPGKAEWPMYGSYWVRVLRDLTTGEEYTSEVTREMSSYQPTLDDLVAGGYCLDRSIQECSELRELGAGYLCYGHYSYEVVFQRQW